MSSSFGGPGEEESRKEGYGSVPNWQPGVGLNKQAQPPVVKPVRIDVSKRAVALVIDVAVAYGVGIIVSFIPLVNSFLPITTTMVIYLLCRDFFFDGRGIGKNLMGLQVVDIHTGKPAALVQSIKRNIILLAPLIVREAVDYVLRFIPIAVLNQTVDNLIGLVGMVYVAIVLPLESYRAYSRADGQRIGDEIADTAIVEAPMSFANIVPRARS